MVRVFEGDILTDPAVNTHGFEIEKLMNIRYIKSIQDETSALF